MRVLRRLFHKYGNVFFWDLSQGSQRTQRGRSAFLLPLRGTAGENTCALRAGAWLFSHFPSNRAWKGVVEGLWRWPFFGRRSVHFCFRSSQPEAKRKITLCPSALPLGHERHDLSSPTSLEAEWLRALSLSKGGSVISSDRRERAR